MTVYYVKGDILNSYINVALAAGPIGGVVVLPKQSLNPVTNHLMSSVVSGLKDYRKDIEKQKLKHKAEIGSRNFFRW